MIHIIGLQLQLYYRRHSQGNKKSHPSSILRLYTLNFNKINSFLSKRASGLLILLISDCLDDLDESLVHYGTNTKTL